MPNSESTLASALNELAAVGTERDREHLVAVLDRLDAARLRVLVTGEAQRGKSTLVNALLGREVLPSGITPLTGVTVAVRYGDGEHAEVRFLDGNDEKHPLAALTDLVTERGDPGNCRGIVGVTVYLASSALVGGVELVDTPGTGSVLERGNETAHETLRSMDAGVFVLTADPPVSASERDLPGQLAGQVGTLLNGELRRATAAQIEWHGRDQLAALAVMAAETWRQQRRDAIEQGLAGVDARLAESRQFSYIAGQAELLAGAIRRWLPASSADGRPGSICVVRPRAWPAARSAGPAATCGIGWPRRRRRIWSWPDRRRRCAASWPCSTGLRKRRASMPAAAPIPRGPTVLTLYSAVDLLTGPGCPVCRYAGESADRYLAWFALEAHADAVTINKLCSSLGMCPRHTRGLMSQPGAATRLTAVYRYVIEAARTG